MSMKETIHTFSCFFFPEEAKPWLAADENLRLVASNHRIRDGEGWEGPEPRAASVSGVSAGRLSCTL
jgi:hypothetical protein